MVPREPESNAVQPCATGPDEKPGQGEIRWRDWWQVGCGVESLHAVLTDTGREVTLDEALADALALGGYDDAVGWRHRALVDVARRHGLAGEIVGELTPEAIARGGVSTRWLVSVRAPEQFESTHLIAVHPLGSSSVTDGVPAIDVFWPQGHLEFGERFVTTPEWLAPRMTGRGMRFDEPSHV